MGIFFESYQANCCCLCGSSESLTGEHKIKASALREIFGQNDMYICRFDRTGISRRAQGSRSRAFHFSSRICSLCNNARTQAPDYEFDEFHKQVIQQLAEGKDPASVFSLPRYSRESRPYLNVFRYFAKLLCCHIAESCGPRVIEISKFAIGETNRNPVFLSINADPTYATHSTVLGEHQFAGHGGFIVSMDSTTKLPTGFHSSLSLGAVRYEFWVRHGSICGLAIRVFYPNFLSRCETASNDARGGRLSDME